ncbi:ABC transporter substrate-binding protein [Clostridium folliculivorans]|uniref:ABC transporter substrate-binding protein n=1 Tax=Clostridium folliculivorans TaxID=2886038 RepID=A0A9W5XYP8_9CLOT|nr:zinc ABC transporter substrate-binding protein [Clostridium folliculivorans]GKU23360.1 ABC transporter substrate-binding protein [Clostridium folliculivorans]GKU29477.1 ABC transporter substrate-binding protein [Clostridium folliculivorans]
MNIRRLGLKVATLLSSLLLVTSFVGCTKSTGKTDSDKLKVTVSINPLKEFAEAIGKDKIDVNVMVPEGMEPHDFEPKSKDLVDLNKSSIFVYNGFGMEEWLDKVEETIEDKNKIELIDSSKGIEQIKTDGKVDPHIWLSLKNAEIQSYNIKEALVKADSKNKDFYEKNYKEFTDKLEKLYQDNKTKFSELKTKDFVTGHEAFGYLCRDFGLKQMSVEDVFAEGEITPQKLKDLVEFCRANNIKTIFSEQLASPKVSQTLANEVGAKIQTIYTIESKEDNKDYYESMKDNLDKIYNSLK